MASPGSPRNFSPHGSRSQLIQVPPPDLEFFTGSEPFTAMYLVSPPLPRGVSAVQFNIVSHDQGWCDNPSNGVWSWFDVSILGSRREDESPAFSDLLDPSYFRSRPEDFGQVLQDRGLPFKGIPRGNPATPGITKRVAANKIHESWGRQIITWRLEDGGAEADFLSLLEGGDRLVIWARTQFFGWLNFVKEVEIRVSVDEAARAMQIPIRPALPLFASASESVTLHKGSGDRHVIEAMSGPAQNEGRREAREEDDTRGRIPQAFDDIFEVPELSLPGSTILNDLEHYNRRITEYEAILDTMPVYHPTRSNVLDITGLLLAFRHEVTGNRGDIVKAIAYLQLAVLLRPDEPRLRQHYVIALVLRGRHAPHGSDVDTANDELIKALESCHCSATQWTDLVKFLFQFYVAYGFQNTQDRSVLRKMCDIMDKLKDFSQLDPYTEVNFLEARELLASMQHGEGMAGRAREGFRQIDLFQREHIDMTISAAEKALLTIPQIDPKHADLLDKLSTQYHRRYRYTEELNDLNSAILYAEKALALLHPNTHLSLSLRLGLCHDLSVRSNRKHDNADMHAAALHKWAALRAAPLPDGLQTALLASAYKIQSTLYSAKRKTNYLEFAIKRLESLGNDHSERVHWAVNVYYFLELEGLYEMKFSVTRTLHDLNQAITLIEKVVALIPEGLRPKADMTLKLGTLWLSRFDLTDNIKDFRTGIAKLYSCFFASDASPLTRVSCANLMIHAFTHFGYWMDICILDECLLPSLAHFSGREIQRDDQIYLNRQFKGFGGLICAAFCRKDLPVQGALKLEYNRGRIMGHLVDAQSDISSLKIVEPDLAEEYESLRQRAFNNSLGSEFEDMPQSKSRHEYVRELGQCEEKIRQVTGFEDFLQPLDKKNLPGIVQEGPIVIVNSTCVSTDAILITHLGTRALSLPDMIPKAPQKYQQLFPRGGDTRGVDRCCLDVRDIECDLLPEDLTHELLTWLWYTCVKLCLDALASDGVLASGNKLSRIWWIGAGAASALPFHAAGDYSNGIPSNGESCLDRVISSYTPTIKTLCNARQRASEALPRTRDTSTLLAVTMPETPGHDALYGVRQEVKGIIQSAGHALQIKEMQGPSASDVLSHLQNDTTEMVHFACHGYSDPVNPLDSHLVLQKHQKQEGDPSSTVLVPDQLKLSALLDTKTISSACIAYLSACSTAEGKDQSLRDEALNIANGFLVAGFSHVIGSLWAADDEVCVDMAASFYKALVSRRASADSGDLNRAVAGAVRDATLETRRKYANNPAAWALYVHIGA